MKYTKAEKFFSERYFFITQPFGLVSSSSLFCSLMFQTVHLVNSEMNSLSCMFFPDLLTIPDRWKSLGKNWGQDNVFMFEDDCIQYV